MQSQDVPKGAVQPDWWAAGSAAHRPNVGTIPMVNKGRTGRRSWGLSVFLFLCGVAAMVMSHAPWITGHFLRHVSTVYGTDKVLTTAFGVNGWATFIGGACVAGLTGLMLVFPERLFKALIGLVTGGTAGVAIYELVRVLQKLHYAHSQSARMGALAPKLLGRAHVGYGLIALVSVSVVAFLASLLLAGSDA